MKTIVLFSILLLLAACASPTAVIQNQFDCSPGQDLEIRAGLSDPTRTGEQTGQYMFLVEVANNGHQEVTVRRVRIEPDDTQRRSGRNTPLLQRASKDFNQTIPDGTEHVFELPATEFASYGMPDPRDQIAAETVEFRVTVELTNGDSYRCPFSVARR